MSDSEDEELSALDWSASPKVEIESSQTSIENQISGLIVTRNRIRENIRGMNNEIKNIDTYLKQFIGVHERLLSPHAKENIDIYKSNKDRYTNAIREELKKEETILGHIYHLKGLRKDLLRNKTELSLTEQELDQNEYEEQFKSLSNKGGKRTRRQKYRTRYYKKRYTSRNKTKNNKKRRYSRRK